jgi:hypothetical protein
VGYFETQRGLAPDAEEYSAELLAIDAEAGPWLAAAQASSPVARCGASRWRLDADRRALTFADAERDRVVARIEVVGTYDAAARTWLWAWANPHLDSASAAAARVRDQHPEVRELAAPSERCGETKAWALAAAAAHLLGAESCYRLPGEGGVATFVALFDVRELDRAPAATADPEAAAAALASYAGPAALSLGALLLAEIEAASTCFDSVIEALHRVCANLDALSASPLGAGTAAAAEAAELAGLLRQGALCLALPPGDSGPRVEDAAAERPNRSLAEGARELLELLHHVGQRFGARADDMIAGARGDAP